MIRFRFKELLADKSFKENRRVTIEEVARETGIHRTTLSKISNKNGYSATTEVLDLLCEYFGCEISDIAEHIKKDDQT